MKKDQFLHLHGLFGHVRKFLNEDTDLDCETEQYDETNIRPVSVHKSKEDHKEAVMTLSTEIAESIDQKQKETLKRT